MYEPFSRDGGGIIGEVGGSAEEVDLSEAALSTGVEESLICFSEVTQKEMSLTARLDPESGAVAWGEYLTKDEIMSRTCPCRR
jgi:hypothetical protein